MPPRRGRLAAPLHVRALPRRAPEGPRRSGSRAGRRDPHARTRASRAALRPRRTRAPPRSGRGCTPHSLAVDRRVDADDDGADRHDGPVEQDPFEPCAGEHGDDVAAADAAREQGVRERLDAARGLGPRAPRASRPPAPRGRPGPASRCSRTYRQSAGAVRVSRGESVGSADGDAVVTTSSYAGRDAVGEGENARSLYNSRTRHADDLERLDLLRPGQHPHRAGPRDAADRRLVPDAPPRVRDADQAEAVVPAPRARGRARRAREGLGGREGRVRARRGVRPRVGRAPALAVDRHPPLRQARGRRSRLLRPHVLPRARSGRRRAAPVRAAPPRDAGDGHGGRRQVRALGQGESLPHPRAGRRARARDALLRRRRPGEERDRGGRGGGGGEEGRAHARRAGDREPRRRVVDRGVRERVPARPEGDARGEARRRADRAPGAGHRDAGRRPDGGAAPQRRRGAGRQARREARESRKPARRAPALGRSLRRARAPRPGVR